MGEYKPLGSEKLNGDDKLKRILELTYYNEKNKKSSNKPELVKESKAGKKYAIVKEKDGYYVKMGLNEQTLDYIGGLFMKNKNRFKSYAEALKRLELLKGQDKNINEEIKYVLKTKSEETSEQTMPAPDAPAPDAPMPAPDASAPAPDASAPTPDAPAPDGVPAETGTPKKSDYMAEVQKFAGKLGQELRDQKERMESDDIKYVLNMVISAVDLNKLELEDIKEIGKKFERDEEEGAVQPSDFGAEEPTPTGAEEPSPTDAEQPMPEPSGEEEVPFQAAESELYELDELGGLEEFINSEIDLSNYMDMDETDSSVNNEEDKVVEVDMEKLKNEVKGGIDDILKKYFKNA